MLKYFECSTREINAPLKSSLVWDLMFLSQHFEMFNFIKLIIQLNTVKFLRINAPFFLCEYIHFFDLVAYYVKGLIYAIKMFIEKCIIVLTYYMEVKFVMISCKIRIFLIWKEFSPTLHTYQRYDLRIIQLESNRVNKLSNSSKSLEV